MTNLLAKVLRAHDEPHIYVEDATVHRALTAAPADYLAYVGNWLTLLADGRATLELPPKWIWTDAVTLDGGDFRVMPCVVRHGAQVIKTVKLVGTNRRQREVPDQITVGKAFHLHPQENFITHIFDACLLSSARTGLCAALALQRLAPVRRRVTVIGAGRVGYYAALYTTALGGVDEVVFRDAQPERARVAAAAFTGTRCRVETVEEPVDCDALILATTAQTPFCKPATTKAAVVISLGADTEEQHELSPDWPCVADVYVDGADCRRVGDVRAWLAAGLVVERDLTDLLGLWRDGPRPVTGRTRIFISTGSALLDNLTIGYLLEHASA
jgi:ornithine cyclodeaminase/alanine dehydrogenase-like protein (mu-crystallin family)